jgi:hypothetical protein
LYVGKAAGFVTTEAVKAEQNDNAPALPSLFIARRQLSELQMSAEVVGFVTLVLELELDLDVDVGDWRIEPKPMVESSW